MVKNWVVLGDEAFDSEDSPMGILYFSSDEMKNWQEVALNRLSEITSKNEKVKEMISNSKLITVEGFFYKKLGISIDDLRLFANDMSECLGIKNPTYVDINYDRRSNTNSLFIGFLDFNFLEWLDAGNP